MAIYVLRPLSTGEVLDGALTLLRRHFRLVLSIALVCEGIPSIIDVYVDLPGGGRQNPGLALLDRLLSAIGALLVTGATVRVVSEAYLGRTPRLRDALGFAGDKLGAIFGANFASGILTGLAFLALVIPGIVVACGYSVAAQVAALESPGSAGGALGVLGGALDAAVAVVTAFVSLLVYPVISCVFTLFYYDLRVRKEGFDLEVLAKQLGLGSEA